MELEVLLGDVRVGVLSRASARGDASSFRLYQSYRDAYPRPVLGQAFEDDLGRVWRSTQRLPTFFSNLLPEADGPLRKMIAARVGVHPSRELHLLAHVGEDLPGNVIVRPLTDLDVEDPEEQRTTAAQTDPVADLLRFSLAGVQLKFSVLREEQRLTLPLKGIGGDWIVKLPDRRFAHVPQNEWSVMHWAQLAGIAVPEFELFGVDALKNIPPELLKKEEPFCYAVRRFDRPRPSVRVHMEDFAQVLGLYDQGKYDAYNYESIGSIILTVCGVGDLREYVRRLVFMVVSGNADAHHKNWSLIYPDGRTARLSPAYDQVATVVYPSVDQSLALNFSKSKRFGDVSLDGFRGFARKLKRDPDEMTRWVREDIVRIRDAWSLLPGAAPLAAEAREAIEQHMSSLPLLGGRQSASVAGSRMPKRRPKAH